MKPDPEIQYPIHDLLSKRWSPRAFSNKSIESGKVLSLFEAVRWSASSRNEQPWRFIYATKENKEGWDKLLSCLAEWNQSWAKTADLLILTMAKMNYDYKNMPNEHAYFDLGLGLGNMSTQATSMGIYLHHMGGFNAEKAIELFGIMEPLKPVSMIAGGYPGDIKHIPEDIAADEYKAQERILVDEFILEA
jgi:nitroreductase